MLFAVAVKVTDVPEQTAPAGEAARETVDVRFGLTVIVTVFEVAGLPVKHGDAFDVNTQVTRSLLAKVEVV